MNKMMKKFALLFLLLLLVAVPNVHSGARATWNRVILETNDLKKPITISVSTEQNLISEFTVRIGSNEITIPDKELSGTKNPHLNTLKVGYWDDASLSFYIALECGILSSYPDSASPKANFYIFRNGKYSHREKYDLILNSPGLDLEFYKLANRNKKGNS